jgi:2'-5' RNA ligase
LQTGELGVFPSEQQPRVIWLGLRGQAQELTRLHADLAATLTELDFPVEQRPLAPHITLGRLREPPAPEVAAAIRRRLSSPALRERVTRGAVSIPVREVVLVRSFLERSGARHEPVARYPLSEA